MKIKTEVLTSEYADFIDRSGCFFQSKRYLDLITSCTGIQFFAHVARESGCIVGVIPFATSQHSDLGTVVNSLPFYGGHGGVVSENDTVTRQLLEYFVCCGEQEGYSAWTVVEPLQDEMLYAQQVRLYQSALGVVSSDCRIGQITPIAPGTDLMASFHQKTRNMVRKSKKSGLVIYEGLEHIEKLALLHEENMAEIGGAPKPRMFFERIPEFFSEDRVRVFAACDPNNKDEFCAGLLCFYHGSTVEYFTPVVKKSRRSEQPLSLLIFHAMEAAQKDEFHFWNWGGTWRTQEGVYRFKSRWGAVDKTYNYYTKVIRDSLRQSTVKELSDAFPYFYVMPFDQLS